MTKHDLKELAAMGAELGAAKAEVDKLRAILEGILFCGRGTSGRIILEAEDEDRIRGALMQASPCQAQNGPCPGDGVSECKDCPTAVDMATAAAQGFRDGQAAVEQAPAQDELTAFDAWYATEESFAAGDSNGWYGIARAAWMARAARPAQTAPQPEQSGYLPLSLTELLQRYKRDLELRTFPDNDEGDYQLRWTAKEIARVNAALSSQGGPP